MSAEDRHLLISCTWCLGVVLTVIIVGLFVEGGVA